MDILIILVQLDGALSLLFLTIENLSKGGLA